MGYGNTTESYCWRDSTNGRWFSVPTKLSFHDIRPSIDVIMDVLDTIGEFTQEKCSVNNFENLVSTKGRFPGERIEGEQSFAVVGEDLSGLITS